MDLTDLVNLGTRVAMRDHEDADNKHFEEQKAYRGSKADKHRMEKAIQRARWEAEDSTTVELEEDDAALSVIYNDKYHERRAKRNKSIGGMRGKEKAEFNKAYDEAYKKHKGPRYSRRIKIEGLDKINNLIDVVKALTNKIDVLSAEVKTLKEQKGE